MSKPTLPPHRRIAADDRDLERRVRTLETRSTGALDAPTWTYFGGSWDPGSGAEIRPRYCKDALGFVHIEGKLINGTGSTFGPGGTLFTLPAGFRPRGSTSASVPDRDHYPVRLFLPAESMSTVTIGADGAIAILGSISINTNQGLWLGHISFFAEN